MKKPNQLSSLLNKLFEHGKNYLGVHVNLLKLEVVDKTARILGTLVFIFVALFLGFGALAYLSVALVHWMGQYMSTSIACLILGAIFLVALYIIFAVKQKVFIDSFIRLLSSMLFEEKQEDNQQLVKQENKEGEQ